jgi:hypothetical protein
MNDFDEDIIVIVDSDGYVSHGVGSVTLRGYTLPPEEFCSGWGGAKWCKDRCEWVIPAGPRKARQRIPETRLISYS